MSFFIVEKKYDGPNADQDQYVDEDTIEIRTEPARMNMSDEVCTNGWCGTTDGWAVYAHGEYETVQQARDAIERIFGAVRDRDTNGDEFEPEDEAVKAIFKPGKYEPKGPQATREWSSDGIEGAADADTTDDEIADLVLEFEGAANAQGMTLDQRALEDAIRVYRKECTERRAEGLEKLAAFEQAIRAEMDEISRYEQLREIVERTIGDEGEVAMVLAAMKQEAGPANEYGGSKIYYREPAAALAHSLIEYIEGDIPSAEAFSVAAWLNPKNGEGPYWAVATCGNESDFGATSDLQNALEPRTWFEDAWADDAHKLEDDEEPVAVVRRAARAVLAERAPEPARDQPRAPKRRTRGPGE